MPIISIKMCFIIFSLFFVIKISLSEDKVPSICENDGIIDTADRLANDTYRVYRGDYYWELIGLPERKATVKGPYLVPYPNMLPINQSIFIMTIITGAQHATTYKFGFTLDVSLPRERWWCWKEDGSQITGGTNNQGNSWPGMEIPVGGWTAAFNDGDMDKKGYPVMIAFKDLRVYYYNTGGGHFTRIGEYAVEEGQNGEQFPANIIAAMAFNKTDPKGKYYVYLFKHDQYCFRPLIGEKGCKEWRPNKELFGCSTEGPPNGKPSEPSDPNPTGSPTEANPVTDNPNNGCNSLEIQNLQIILFLFIFFSLFY